MAKLLVRYQNGNLVAYEGSADGAALRWDASTSEWVSGAGGVLSIAAGNGLLGGTISNSGTIAVDFGTSTNKVAQGNDARFNVAPNSVPAYSLAVTNGLDWTALALGAANTVLRSSGTGVGFGKVALATDVSGTIPVGNGGTGVTSYTVGDILYASASDTLSKLSAGAARRVLTSGGASTAPTWDVVPYDLGGSAEIIPASKNVFLLLIIRPVKLGSIAADFLFKAITGAASTSTTLTLEKVAAAGGTTTIGSVTFLAGGSTAPTFSVTTADVTLVAGDYLRLYSGASVDTTLANVMFTFKNSVN